VELKGGAGACGDPDWFDFEPVADAAGRNFGRLQIVS
jgi:hypothetical protein